MCSEWQPIETAPKDGTVILACFDKWYHPMAVCWAAYHPNAKGKACWRTSAIGGDKVEQLTHWMPLPSPPTPEGTQP